MVCISLSFYTIIYNIFVIFLTHIKQTHACIYISLIYKEKGEEKEASVEVNLYLAMLGVTRVRVGHCATCIVLHGDLLI